MKQKIMETFKNNKLVHEKEKSKHRWVIINKFKPPKSKIALGKEDKLISDLYNPIDSAEIAKMILNSEIISQEKASCMPVASLKLKKGN